MFYPREELLHHLSTVLDKKVTDYSELDDDDLDHVFSMFIASFGVIRDAFEETITKKQSVILKLNKAKEMVASQS